MIPVWPVDLEVDVPGPNVAWLGPDLRMRGWVMNNAHDPIMPGDWGLADRIIAREAHVVTAAEEGARSPEEFESLLRDAEEDDREEDWSGIDLGVAGLVYALNAAGFATATSCRKHVDDPFGDHPFVIATGDERRIALLLPLVEEADAGACVDVPGEGFGIYASTVRPLMKLADLITQHQTRFIALPETIPWDDDLYHEVSDY